jgi:hypothetical protein
MADLIQCEEQLQGACHGWIGLRAWFARVQRCRAAAHFQKTLRDDHSRRAGPRTLPQSCTVEDARVAILYA